LLVGWVGPLRGVDRILTRVYRAGGWVLYTRPAQVALALLSAAGIGAFVYESARDPLAGHTPVVALLLPALYGSVFLHELGHALTTKAYGRDVAAAGIGWYWFGPVAYVATSDMWLAGRRARIAAAAAGPLPTGATRRAGARGWR